MKIEPEIHATSIVVRGAFTPGLFQPAWLASHELIPEGEANTAQIEVIHPKAAIFSTEWLQFRVIEDRFQVATTLAPYFEILRDLVSGIFKVLPEVPFRAVGLNQSFHFRLPSEDIWHQVGHRLAPKDLWNEILVKPGTLNVAIHSDRDDEFPGYIRVQVQPSARIKFGLFIDINDHYQMAKDNESPHTDTQEIRSVLAQYWDSSTTRAQKIASSILTLADI